MLPDIQSIIARQLDKPVSEIDPDQTFAAIGADDLDLVEITMEVEDTFGIAIRHDSLVDAANAAGANTLCNQLTVRTFAAVAEESPKQPAPKTDSELQDDGILRESQVGTFGDLSELPNPEGFVLVFIPSLEELTRLQEQRLGRKLDDKEVDTLRRDAAVIALPQEMADQLKRRNSQRNSN